MREAGLLDCFELLHFHLGSQISNIRNVKNALREASRFYVEVSQAGRAAEVPRRGRRPGRRLRRLADQLRLVDELHHRGVRQRRGVQRDGGLQRGRRAAPHPGLRVGPRGGGAPRGAGHRGAGRAASSTPTACRTALPEDASPVVRNLWATYRDVTRKNLLEAYHDATEYKEECLTLFSLGHLHLEQRVLGREPLLGALPEDPAASPARWTRCPRSSRRWSASSRTPTSATSRCSSRCPTAGPSTSSSRSMPIHRLNEKPTRRGGAGRHHLRLGREDRALHRPARREGRAGAAPAQRRRLLPGHLPGGRLPGDPRRPAQPLRRHQRGAGVARAQRWLPHRPRGARATRSPRCSTTSATTRTTWWRGCGASPRPRCARAPSPSTSRASCCAPTRRGWPATRTWSARWTLRPSPPPAAAAGGKGRGAPAHRDVSPGHPVRPVARGDAACGGQAPRAVPGASPRRSRSAPTASRPGSPARARSSPCSTTTTTAPSTSRSGCPMPPGRPGDAGRGRPGALLPSAVRRTRRGGSAWCWTGNPTGSWSGSSSATPSSTSRARASGRGCPPAALHTQAADPGPPIRVRAPGRGGVDDGRGTPGWSPAVCCRLVGHGRFD